MPPKGRTKPLLKTLAIGPDAESMNTTNSIPKEESRRVLRSGRQIPYFSSSRLVNSHSMQRANPLQEGDPPSSTIHMTLTPSDDQVCTTDESSVNTVHPSMVSMSAQSTGLRLHQQPPNTSHEQDPPNKPKVVVNVATSLRRNRPGSHKKKGKGTNLMASLTDSDNPLPETSVISKDNHIDPFEQSKMAEFVELLSKLENSIVFRNGRDSRFINSVKTSVARSVRRYEKNAQDRNIVNAMSFYYSFMKGHFLSVPDPDVIVLDGNKYQIWRCEESWAGEKSVGKIALKEAKGTFLSPAQGVWESQYLTDNNLRQNGYDLSVVRIGAAETILGDDEEGYRV